MSFSSSAPGSLLPGAPPPSPQGDPAPQGGPSGSRLRLPVLAVGGAALVAVAAVAGLLFSGGGGDAGTAGPAVTHAARTTVPSASATPTPSVAGTPAGVSSGRNPFLPPAGAAGVSGGATTATDGSGQPASAPASAAAPTVTVTSNATYVGLYALSGSKATFWVNDTQYQVSAGGTFAGFTYTGKSSTSCANVTKSGTTTTICVGTVKQLG